MSEIDPVEALTDHDIKTLEELSTCLLGIWSEEIEEKGRSKIYDNKALEDFMAVFTVMVDDLVHKKNIRDYISHIRGAYLTIEVPVRYG